MTKILDLHDWVFQTISRLLSPWFLPTAARFSFASVLLFFFWNSGKTKLGDDIFTPSFGAYSQILPTKIEAVGYDEELLSTFDVMIVLFGTYAEFILPAMVVIGLFTRLASLGMIGFIVMMSVVDIYGHGIDAATIGTMFDRISNGLILDQRLMWVFILLVPVINGAGPISVDYLLRKFRK